MLDHDANRVRVRLDAAEGGPLAAARTVGELADVAHHFIAAEHEAAGQVIAQRMPHRPCIDEVAHLPQRVGLAGLQGDFRRRRGGVIGDHQYGGVILVGGNLREAVPPLHETVQGGITAVRFCQRRGEGRVLEVFTRAVLHFEDAIGEEHPLVAGSQRQFAGLVACGAGNAQRRIARSGDLLPALRAAHLRPWQTGAAEPHAARFRAEYHRIDGDETPRLHHAAESLIQGGHPLRNVHGDAKMRGGGDERGAARHVQRGGQTFPAHVANPEEDFAIVDLVPEVEVPADLAGWLVKAFHGDVVDANLGGREEGVLNLRGEGKLLAVFRLVDGFLLRLKTVQGHRDQTGEGFENLHVLRIESRALIRIDRLHDAEAAFTVQ